MSFARGVELRAALLLGIILASCESAPTDPPIEPPIPVKETVPSQVVLNWQGDPSTRMTITWRDDGPEATGVLRFSYDPDRPIDQWRTLSTTGFSFAETSATLFRVELTGLEPDREYHVLIDHPTTPERFRFRTLPDRPDLRELVFLAGGDSRTRRDVRREMNALAAAQEPDFIIFAGDFIESPLSEWEWNEWFDDWHELLITPEGRRIPVIPCIGNHEVLGGYNQSRNQAPFYYNRFALPEPQSHHALRLGPDLLLVTLDSDHTTPIAEQVPWLERTLEMHGEVNFKLVQYHVAAWPSVRDFNGERPVAIRDYWVPIFEQHDVDLVIEAHDHAYKRTWPIRQGQRDDERGVIYTGDGGWGAPLRTAKEPARYWYLREAATADHFWKLTLSADGRTLNVEPIFLGETLGTGFQLTTRRVMALQ